MPAKFASVALLVGVLVTFALADAPLAAQETAMATDLAPPEASTFLDEAIATDAGETPAAFSETPAWGDWQARVGALLLNRISPRSLRLSPLFYYDSAGINATDFNFPLSASPDISLRRPGERVDLDFRYFGVQNATAHTQPRMVTEIVPTEWFTLGPTINTITTRGGLNSTLQSAELNLRWQFRPNISQLVGFRYLQFRDRMQLQQDADLDHWLFSTGYDASGRNEMFGMQIGNEYRLLQFRDKLMIQADIKAGIFGNVASSSLYRYVDEPGSGYSADWFSSARRGGVALVSDINLTATLQLNEHVALRGGYQLLGLVGIATAADQFRNSSSSFSTQIGDSTLYHGAMVGLECAW